MGHYQTKTLRIKKLGWRRIAKNTQKFGWILDDAEEEVTIERSRSYEGRVYNDTLYVDEKVKEKKKVVMVLSFHRDTSEFANYRKISIIEVFYNIIFLIRRIIGIVLPILTIIVFIFALMGGTDQLPNEGSFYLTILFIWFFGIISENILASIFGHCLKYN